MTNTEKCHAITIAMLAITIAFVGASVARSVRAVGVNFATSASFVWYLRFRLFDVTTEMLALGVVAYVLPRTRLTATAARLAALLGVVSFGAEVGEWLLEGGNKFLTSRNGTVAGALSHIAVLGVSAAVVALWFVRASERAAPDLA